MASIASAVGVGNPHSPLSQYAAGVSELFPRPNKMRLLETTIASRYDADVLPTNLGFNMKLSDRYIDFLIPGTLGSFIDLGKLVLHTSVSLTKEDNTTPLEDDQHVEFTNNTAHSLFKSVQCFLGDVAVENNVLYGYTSYVKMLNTLSPNKLNTIGANANINIPENGFISKVTQAYFDGASEEHKTIMKRVKTHGIQLCTPLLLDISSLDSYLLDGISVRLRMELSSNAWLLNSPSNGDKIRLRIDSAKLLYTRLFPYPNALHALNASLAAGNLLKSTFTKTLLKTYVLAKDQTTGTYDQPWGNVIPEKLSLIITSMEAHAGEYTLNPLYLSHGDISQISLSVNGRTMYNIPSKFPHDYAELYHRTLDALGFHKDHLIGKNIFGKGAMICTFDLRAENLNDNLPVEMNGGLRLSLNLSKGENENRLLILFGETVGILTVNSERRLQCDVRA